MTGATKARRVLLQLRCLWYPIMELHNFMVSRIVVNHDGHGGTAPDASAGLLLSDTASTLPPFQAPWVLGQFVRTWCVVGHTKVEGEQKMPTETRLAPSSIVCPDPRPGSARSGARLVGHQSIVSVSLDPGSPSDARPKVPGKICKPLPLVRSLQGSSVCFSFRAADASVPFCYHRLCF